MPSNTRVSNLSNGKRLKFSRALRAVEDCDVVWVEFGVSVRNLDPAEQSAAINERAKRREPLPYAEVFGLKYEPPVGGQAQYREECLLAYEATLFAGLATSPRTAP